MKTEALALKRCWHFSAAFSSQPYACSLFGEGYAEIYPYTGISFVQGRRCRKEAGFLLTALFPILALGTLFLAGSLDALLRAQEKEALQSRLDICAVRLAVSRKHLLERLVDWNSALRLSIKEINLARGIMILAGPEGAAAGSGAESVLLELNHGLAKLQDGALALHTGEEMNQMNCAPSPFSKTFAFCTASPPLLLSFQREKTFFPDVDGALVQKGSARELANIRCQGRPSSGKALATKLVVRGDGTLSRKNFTDAYLQ